MYVIVDDSKPTAVGRAFAKVMNAHDPVAAEEYNNWKYIEPYEDPHT